MAFKVNQDFYVCGASGLEGSAIGYVLHYAPDGTLLHQITDSTGILSPLNSSSGPSGGFIYGGYLWITNFASAPPEYATYLVRLNLDLTDPQLIFTFTGGDGVEGVNFYNGDLLVGGVVYSYGLWTITTAGVNKSVVYPNAEDSGVDWITVDQAGRTMYYTSEGPHILRWDLETQTQLPNLPTDFSSYYPPYTFHGAFQITTGMSGNMYVATQPNTGQSMVFKVATDGTVLGQYVLPVELNYAFGLAVSPDETVAYVPDESSNQIFALDLTTGTSSLFALAPGPTSMQLAGCINTVGVNNIPPIRQYPRDDNLALGAPRQRSMTNGPTSYQNSYRQYPRGSYA